MLGFYVKKNYRSAIFALTFSWQKNIFVKAIFKPKVDKIEDFIALTLRSLRLCVKKKLPKAIKIQKRKLLKLSSTKENYSHFIVTFLLKYTFTENFGEV